MIFRNNIHTVIWWHQHELTNKIVTYDTNDTNSMPQELLIKLHLKTRRGSPVHDSPPTRTTLLSDFSFFFRIFTESALWADSVYKSKCPSVCPSVCVSVCQTHNSLRYYLVIKIEAIRKLDGVAPVIVYPSLCNPPIGKIHPCRWTIVRGCSSIT